VNDIDTGCAQIIKAVALLFKTAQAGQIQIGERAGVKGGGRFNQGDFQGWITALQVTGSGCTAKAATDHNDMGRAAARVHRQGAQGQTSHTGFTDTAQPLATGGVQGGAHS
jgi:hypothetical protein